MNHLTALRKIDDMRLYVEAYSRSKYCTEKRLLKIIGDLRLLLEQRNINVPTSLANIGFEFGLDKFTRDARLGLKDRFTSDYSEDEQLMMDRLSNGSDVQRVSQWRYRIGAHAHHMRGKGWYPFFITLTIDRSQLSKYDYDSKRFWQESQAFRIYLRHLARIAGRAKGWTQKQSDKCKDDLMQYVGVLEHGKSKEHDHAHVLVWLAEIPDSWKQCPNRNRSVKDYTQCWDLKQYWHYGFSKCDYFRTAGDVWSRLGFCIPEKAGKPQQVFCDTLAGSYLCKYMVKELRTWNHRIRATRALGMTKLDEFMRSMTLKELENLVPRPPSYKELVKLTQRLSLPLGLIRTRAKRHIFSKIWASRSIRILDYLKPKPKSFVAMLASVRNGAKIHVMSLPQYYDWLQSVLPPDLNEFCNASFDKICKKFPRVEAHPQAHLAGVS